MPRQLSFDSVRASKTPKKLSVEEQHELECRACPYNLREDLVNPKMEATGSSRPLFYALGEGPGENEDLQGEQFVGWAGEVLREAIERKQKKFRFNNVIRCRPPGNATPKADTIEPCRPSIERDIAKTKPYAIFGFGNVPLTWALNVSAITAWRGRRIPVNIGGHPCWYFPMFHPSYVRRSRFIDDHGDEGGLSYIDWTFRRDINRAIDFITGDDYYEPEVIPQDEILADITQINGDLPLLEKAFKILDDADIVSFDIETTGVSPYGPNKRILSIGLSDGYNTFAIAVDHPQSKWSEFPKELIVNFLKRSKSKKIAHNYPFDASWLGVHWDMSLIRGMDYGCTQNAAYVLDERIAGHVQQLNSLCLMYFGFHLKTDPIIEKNKSHLQDVDLSRLLPYNGGDVKWTARIWPLQVKEIEKRRQLDVLDMQMRRVSTVTHTSVIGQNVDQDQVVKLLDYYEGIRKGIESDLKNDPAVKKFNEVYKFPKATKKNAPTPEFNPQSYPQCLYLMKRILHVPGIENSTDKESLASVNHPIAQDLLDYRVANKMISTYLLPLLLKSDLPDSDKMIAEDGLLHDRFSTTTTQTGRLSSGLSQVFPRRDPVHKRIRRFLVPPKGYRLFSIDYASIEVRVLAAVSRDDVLTNMLWDRYDAHGAWAKRFMQVTDQVDGSDFKVLRDKVKNKWVFPLFYGASVKSACGYMELPKQIIEPLYEEFWDQFSGIQLWQKRVVKDYNDEGFIRMITGRRRHEPLTKNEIINSHIQGPASDICVNAMDKLSEEAEEREWISLQPRANIHDSLTFFILDETWEEDLLHICRVMVQPDFEWCSRIPIGVEISTGSNMCDMRPIGEVWSDKLKKI